MTKVAAKDFAETLSTEDFFDEYIQNSHWSQDFKTSKCWEMLNKEASKRNIYIIEEDEFDYDNYFYNLYCITEKGLS